MKKWYNTTDTYIWLFNVGRGLSVFIRTPNNHGILYDLGASADFSPIEFMEKNIFPHIKDYKISGTNTSHKVAQLILSHPHLDHIFEVDNIKKIGIAYITCPHDKDEIEGIDFDRIGNHDKVTSYKELYAKRNLPLQTIQYSSQQVTAIQAEYGIYYIRPTVVTDLHLENDHHYGNGCSIVFYYQYGPNSILIPGDITPEAFEYLLKESDGSEKRYSIFSYESKFKDWHSKTSNQPSLISKLKTYGLTILVPPHHGLESCFSEFLFSNIKGNKPRLNIISEKRTGETEGKVDARYQSKNGSFGMNVSFEDKIEERNSITTKDGNHYLIKFTNDKRVEVFGAKNPELLLNK